MKTNLHNSTRAVIAIVALLVSTLFLYINTTTSANLTASIFTTIRDGTAVNQNIYGFDTDVYLSGGPQNVNAKGLPNGTYYFQITDPSGNTLLSTDLAICRQLQVINGRVAGSTGPACKHPNGIFNPANGTLPVQMAPFDPTPNNGMEYKAWIIPVAKATIGGDGKHLIFSNSDAKTDNFKVQAQQVQQGSCAPSSSLSVLVSGTNVIAYVPKGCWFCGATGVSVVNVEGSSITNTLIPTADVINSCASNPVTGQTVCTANNNMVYVFLGTALDPSVVPNPFASGAMGSLNFSGGSCTNCGVAMDATNNRAVIAVSTLNPPVGLVGGFQFLDLSTATLGSVFASQAPTGGFNANISEDSLIDPIRNLLLSANENNNYELIDVAPTPSPSPFYEMPIPNPGEADSSGEDCSTGIALAPYEFTDPSQVMVTDLNSAVFVPGSPGSWTSSCATVNTLTESSLSAGASGIAVAQGTHTGIVSGEFGGDAITAIALPATSGVCLLPDWLSCNIGGGFSNGFDPHTVTAYQSPNAPNHAFALLADGSASTLAVVDLTNMLDTTIVPRTVPGHGCLSSPLPATVVTFIAVP